MKNGPFHPHAFVVDHLVARSIIHNHQCAVIEQLHCYTDIFEVSGVSEARNGYRGFGAVWTPSLRINFYDRTHKLDKTERGHGQKVMTQPDKRDGAIHLGLDCLLDMRASSVLVLACSLSMIRLT